MGCPSFSFGLYFCYFDDTREMQQVFMKFVDLYFPFLDHVFPYNCCMLTNVLCFFLLSTITIYISLHHTSSDSENKIMPGSWVLCSCYDLSESNLYAKFDWPQMYMVDVYFLFFFNKWDMGTPKNILIKKIWDREKVKA